MLCYNLLNFQRHVIIFIQENQMKNIVIIGAGLTGLTSAALLAKEGYNVKVIEKNSAPGGVASRYEKSGFTFDTGPTWYLMPEMFERIFTLLDRKTEDYFELEKMDPSYKIFFSPEEKYNISPEPQMNYKTFKSLEKNGDKKLKKYLSKSKFAYDIAVNEFLYKDYDSIFAFFNKRMILDGPKMHVLSKLDSYVKRFFKNKKARQMIEYNIVFLGCSPYNSPAMYTLMSHVDITEGVYYPKGGIYKLVEALYKICLEYDVDFYFDDEVTNLEIEDKRIQKVKTRNNYFSTDIVLSAADYHHTEMNLIPKKYRSYSNRFWESKILAPGVFLLFLGLNKELPELEHHNLFLAEDWEDHFNTIFKKPSWPQNPSYYIKCPTKQDKTMAPKGKDNLFILVPIHAKVEDTEKLRKEYEDKIINHLEQLTGTSIRDSIEVKKIISPDDFKRNYNSFHGTAMGLAHNLFQTAVFRPRRKSKKIKNMYYAGHYTHPGIGMPMVMIASELAKKRIVKDIKRNKI